jgi:phospholipid transport system substrate-binding protein
MKLFHRIWIPCLLAATLCMAQTPPTTDPAPTARAVMEQVVHDVLAVLRNSSLTKAEKTKQVRQIADEQIDFQTLSRLALGRYWRDLSDAQKADFVVAFTEHVSATHGHLIDDYDNEDVKVTGDRAEERGDYTVQTDIVGKKDGGGTQDVAKADYRLRQIDGRWKIIDITVDGVSMAANFRAQFKEVMDNGGFDQLLKLLREKNLENEK